ncbi:hypothetical protein QBC33DRAFT_451202 [Phialemonium atrogriseum]|uniref:N-acetyltransferase domain-containing protein n=1 Tax=Phialemonium atrogriseum TaxID=1093897 RepID=A0AAJ0FNT0_9PEZI|nr:uncharacterized protein QBC33DRAFT_451202 [Phialemonium atrogriseum]KAK1767475.1 hypothetical protein QBC33DRAFT_451202 [Phialemonium atrogriseum]
MPAILDDPDAPTIYRVSGDPPYPDPALPSLPPSVVPRHVTLRDRQTVASVVPFASRYQVPDSLLRYLNDQFNKEIEGGDTYPMMETMPFEKFASYWFQNFGAIMLLGDIASADEVVEGKDWSKECLGTFYIKPNYPGRSSHVCNAGFIVTDASRNRGVGRLMGETYLDWAPKFGYTYSVFNLVYETNVASCKIWDALGFKRIGRVKGCGNLKSYPGRLIDAIIYGRDLGDGNGNGGNEELVSEERFDKIKFYLKYGRYPNGADRAEKSRLRSAATHYKLLDGDVLMLKDKEVISDPQRQYDIARNFHNQTHAGINKTTATIAERYHWSRIKETVSDVIRNCTECKELGKAQTPLPGGNGGNQIRRSALSALPGAAIPSKRSSPSLAATGSRDAATLNGPRSLELSEPGHIPPFAIQSHSYANANDIAVVTPSHTLQTTASGTITEHGSLARHNPMLQDHPHTHDPDADTFQALLNGTSDVDPGLHSHHHHHHHHHHDDDGSAGGAHHDDDDEADQAAVDRDLEMLIEPQDDDEDENDGAGAGGSNDGDDRGPATMVIDGGGGAVGARTASGKMDVNHLLSSHVDDDEEQETVGRDVDPGRGRGIYDVGFGGSG